MSDFTGSLETQKKFFWEFRLNFLASRLLCCRPVILLSYAVSVDGVANSETLCSLMFLEEYNIAWLCEIHVYLHMSPNVKIDLQWRGLICWYVSCHLIYTLGVHKKLGESSPPAFPQGQTDRKATSVDHHDRSPNLQFKKKTKPLINFVASDYVVGLRKLCAANVSATTEIITESSDIDFLYLHWKMSVVKLCWFRNSPKFFPIWRLCFILTQYPVSKNQPLGAS